MRAVECERRAGWVGLAIIMWAAGGYAHTALASSERDCDRRKKAIGAIAA